MQHEYARRRVWRYSHPNIDPVLSISSVTPSEHRLADARAEELELSARLEAHQETCEACANGDHKWRFEARAGQ